MILCFRAFVVATSDGCDALASLAPSRFDTAMYRPNGLPNLPALFFTTRMLAGLPFELGDLLENQRRQ